MSVKAFDLVPVLEKVTLGSDDDQVHALIESLECCGRNLYVGTSNGYIIHYVFEEQLVADADCVLISCQKEQHKNISNNKLLPVSQVKAVSALNLLLCLCDGLLLVLNLSDFQVIRPLSRLNKINSFCLNENPTENNPFHVQLCLARKKQLQLCILSEEKIYIAKEINLPEPPLALAMDGRYICVAISRRYVVVECESGQLQELCNYDPGFFPLIRRITKEEFLLNGPSALGIFVTTAGTSERPPLPWGEGVISVAYYHPYILALSQGYLTIYSLLDQQQKQRLHFFGGSQLGNFDGRLFLASTDMICALVPVPWQRQVDGLLGDRKVEEALELARYANKAGISEDQFNKIYRSILQRGGFIKLTEFDFQRTKDLFHQSALDARELISLFPGLLSSESTFTRSSPALHEIPNVEHLCHGQPHRIKESKAFLIDYLQSVRNSVQLQDEIKAEVNLALVKLYAEEDNPELLSLVTSVASKEVQDYLLAHQRFHALALCLQFHGSSQAALSIWSKIVSGEYEDHRFPGLSFIASITSQIDDHNLIWKFAEVVLEQDEEMGGKIFTDRSCLENGLKPETVVDFLHRFPVALLKYLESLVFIKNVEREKFHTHLAMLYTDRVTRLQKEGSSVSQTQLEDARKSLQHLLHFSSCLRLQLLLGRTLENNLHYESAILYGKLGEHEKALRILVHQVGDYDAAESYCQQMAKGHDLRYRQKLYHTLLGLYLDPQQQSQQREKLLDPAIRLLNSETVEFDAVKVLQLLPGDWSVCILEGFLNRCLRLSSHRRRSVCLQSALTKQENIQANFRKMIYTSSQFNLTEDRVCSVCQKPFTEANFAWYPNNVFTHPQCVKYIKCPVSGKSFAGPKNSSR